MNKHHSLKNTIICSLCAFLTLLVLFAFSENYRGSGSDASASSQLALLLQKHSSSSKASALGEAHIEKDYSIPADALAGPTPDEACFHCFDTAETDAVLELIEKARSLGLFAEEEPCFCADAAFTPGSKICCYLDESIFALCWKEQLDGKTVSLCEIKLRDASQFRRALTGNSYGSSETKTVSKMAEDANAVIAMSGDYYTIRDFGICVYQGQLRRFSETSFQHGTKSYNIIETCFISSSGDLLFFRRGQETSREELEEFISDNGISFSLSFGPVLVENGEVCEIPENYPIGESEKHASRAGIGQLGKLHYLLMTVSWEREDGSLRGDSFEEFARHFASKGVISAYNLDGGQTSELCFGSSVFNHVDYGSERYVSDSIYFATALS